jgi:hypothetical protein
MRCRNRSIASLAAVLHSWIDAEAKVPVGREIDDIAPSFEGRAEFVASWRTKSNSIRRRTEILPIEQRAVD